MTVTAYPTLRLRLSQPQALKMRVLPALPGFNATVAANKISGIGSSTDKGLARWNGTTGQILQNSTSTLTDDGGLQLNGSGSNGPYVIFAPSIGSTENAFIYEVADQFKIANDTFPWLTVNLVNGGIKFDAYTHSGFLQTDASGNITSIFDEPAIDLVDGATVPLDASLGRLFHLTAAGNRTLLAPSNAPGVGRTEKIVIRHQASGANRTLTLTTGSAGSFRFGSTITGLTATLSGLTDYIGAIWNQVADRWDIVAYSKGY